MFIPAPSRFSVFFEEELERLREIIERLKEENEQLTRQLEAQQVF